MKRTIVSKSEDETKALAKKIWAAEKESSKKRSLLFALYGDLGSGKTTFVKGLAEAMGLKDIVRSPSYTLVNEYDGGLTHIDLWRVEDEREFLRLGVEKYLTPGTVIAIEWAEKVTDFLKEVDAKVIHLKFEHGGDKTRKIIVQNDSERLGASENQ